MGCPDFRTLLGKLVNVGALLLLTACFSRLALGVSSDQPTLSLVVYTRTWPNGLCELAWWQDGRRQRALTNIDCCKLVSFPSPENGYANFVLMFVGAPVTQEKILYLQQTGAADANGLPKDWPRTLPALSGPPQYVIGWDGNSASTSAVPWLDAVHRYYDLHRVEISAAWQEQERQRPLIEAAARQREQQLREAAKTPPTQVRVISIEQPPQNFVPVPQADGGKK